MNKLAFPIFIIFNLPIALSILSSSLITFLDNFKSLESPDTVAPNL